MISLAVLVDATFRVLPHHTLLPHDTLWPSVNINPKPATAVKRLLPLPGGSPGGSPRGVHFLAGQEIRHHDVRNEEPLPAETETVRADDQSAGFRVRPDR